MSGDKAGADGLTAEIQQTQAGLRISRPTSFPTATQTCPARPDALLSCVHKREFTPREGGRVSSEAWHPEEGAEDGLGLESKSTYKPTGQAPC